MNLNKKKHTGLTLIEALIWFALFAMVVYSAFVLYGHYRQEQRIYTVSNELEGIYKTTAALLALTPNTDMTSLVLSKQDLLDFGIYPKTLIKRTSDSTVSVYGEVNINYDGATGMEVTYLNIPYGEVCSKIILSQKLVGWYKVGSLSYNDALTPTTITNFCAGNGTLGLQFWMKPYQPDTLNP